MKAIWITGGSCGIGFATAKEFLKNNWRVIISYRNKEKLNQTKKIIIGNSNNKEIYSIPCDISKREEIHEVV